MSRLSKRHEALLKTADILNSGKALNPEIEEVLTNAGMQSLLKSIRSEVFISLYPKMMSELSSLKEEIRKIRGAA